MSKILFLPRVNKIHIFKPPCNVLLLYRHANDSGFDEFPKISDHLPKISKDFPKLFQRPDERPRIFSTNFRKFPKMSGDFRRLPKTFEEDPKMFR